MVQDTPRPAPPVPPEGFRWVDIVDPAWRIEEGKRCRMRLSGSKSARCERESVAALNRGRHVEGLGRQPSWWAYCPGHLYGRWIRDGVVMYRKLEMISDG